MLNVENDYHRVFAQHDHGSIVEFQLSKFGSAANLEKKPEVRVTIDKRLANT